MWSIGICLSFSLMFADEFMCFWIEILIHICNFKMLKTDERPWFFHFTQDSLIIDGIVTKGSKFLLYLIFSLWMNLLLSKNKNTTRGPPIQWVVSCFSLVCQKFTIQRQTQPYLVTKSKKKTSNVISHIQSRVNWVKGQEISEANFLVLISSNNYIVLVFLVFSQTPYLSALDFSNSPVWNIQLEFFPSLNWIFYL